MRWRQLALACAALVISACSHAIPVTGTFSPPPSLTTIPVPVGVYYGPELRSYEHAGSRMGDRWIVLLGPASVRLFDQAFPALFAQVIPVANRPPLAEGTPRPVGVIEPRIEDFDFTLPFLKTGTYTAEIAYRMTLYTLSGETIASWIVRGVGMKSGEFGFEFSRWPAEAADLAMQDAASKFLEEFRDVPEVRRWLRQLGVPLSGSLGSPSTSRIHGGLR
jgi:hypothetical protein